MNFISQNTLLDISQALRLDIMPPAMQENILTNIISLISEKAGIKIVKQFTEEETAEFNQIPLTEVEKMESYILNKVPNAKEIFEQEAQIVKTDLLNTKI